MFKNIYIHEIERLVNELQFRLDNFFEWKRNNITKPNLLGSNVDSHNSYIQEIVINAAILANMLQGEDNSRNKNFTKQRKAYLKKIGLLENSKLKVLLDRALRDTIVHFDEKIDDLNFGTKITTTNLVRLYNTTIYGTFIECLPQIDARFKLYTSAVFQGQNNEDAKILPIKVYNYTEDCYYNLYAKMHLSDLKDDIKYMKERLKMIKL